MKIFILEDDENRLEVLQREIPKIFPGSEILYARTAKEAKEILSKHKVFDIITLDHDLGGLVFVNSLDENTGYRVAQFIKQNDIQARTFICHSHNPAGAENILSALPECKRVPFFSLVSYLRWLAGVMRGQENDEQR